MCVCFFFFKSAKKAFSVELEQLKVSILCITAFLFFLIKTLMILDHFHQVCKTICHKMDLGFIGNDLCVTYV